jgi:regulator of protease activity HflC (stomatin/prohibitin superfamily)
MKHPIKTVGFGIISLVVVITLFMSWQDVKPGDEGFLYSPYNGGVNTEISYKEGTYLIAPWNDIITYNVRQQSRNYESQVMDENGTDIGVVVAVNYHASKGKPAQLHLMHGESYAKSFIDKKARGAIKDVIGRYTYIEIYSTKREAIEKEIEEILTTDFDGNFVTMDFVEIADVNLPKNIASEITVKETQKQKNKTSELMKVEEKNLADARIEKARGDSSLVVTARFKAEAIELEAKQIAKNPKYIEYLRTKRWDGSYGTGNVFGAGVALIKDMK